MLTRTTLFPGEVSQRPATVPGLQRIVVTSQVTTDHQQWTVETEESFGREEKYRNSKSEEIGRLHELLILWQLTLVLWCECKSRFCLFIRERIHLIGLEVSHFSCCISAWRIITPCWKRITKNAFMKIKSSLCDGHSSSRSDISVIQGRPKFYEQCKLYNVQCFFCFFFQIRFWQENKMVTQPLYFHKRFYSLYWYSTFNVKYIFPKLI